MDTLRCVIEVIPVYRTARRHFESESKVWRNSILEDNWCYPRFSEGASLSSHLCTNSQSKASEYVARAHENCIGNRRHTVAEGSDVTFWERASSILIQNDSELLSGFQRPINRNPENNLHVTLTKSSTSNISSAFTGVFEVLEWVRSARASAFNPNWILGFVGNWRIHL
jgi:hypothetical protein